MEKLNMLEIRRLALILLILSPARPALRGEETDDAADAAPGTAPVEVKVDGAALSYTPPVLPRGRRTARGEMDLLGDATATLEVTRPIAFGRAQLPAGSYALSVEVEDGRSHYLVIEAAGAPAKAPAKKARRSASPGSRKKAGPAEAEPMGPPAPDEDEAAPEAAAGDGTTGDEPPAGSSAKPRARARGEKDARPAPAEPPPARIRAPLAVSPCPKTSETLLFDLKAAGKGSKLRIILRAGGTEARASLRFGERRVAREPAEMP